MIEEVAYNKYYVLLSLDDEMFLALHKKEEETIMMYYILGDHPKIHLGIFTEHACISQKTCRILVQREVFRKLLMSLFSSEPVEHHAAKGFMHVTTSFRIINQLPQIGLGSLR